jgi:hypothetical protein
LAPSIETSTSFNKFALVCSTSLYNSSNLEGCSLCTKF